MNLMSDVRRFPSHRIPDENGEGQAIGIPEM